MCRAESVREVLGVARQPIPDVVFELVVVIQNVLYLLLYFFLLLVRVRAFAMLACG